MQSCPARQDQPAPHPYRAAVVHIAATPVMVAAAGQEQELVFFFTGAVFVSFLAGLVAMAPWQSTSTKRPWPGSEAWPQQPPPSLSR